MMDMLNVASTGIYTILALIAKSKENACKIMNVIAKISRYLERSVVTLKLRKEYLNTVTHNTSVLLQIKRLNSLIYRTLFYVNIYGSYKLPCTLDMCTNKVYLLTSIKCHINISCFINNYVNHLLQHGYNQYMYRQHNILNYYL